MANQSSTRIRLSKEAIEQASFIAKVYDIQLREAIEQAIADKFYDINAALYSPFAEIENATPTDWNGFVENEGFK